MRSCTYMPANNSVPLFAEQSRALRGGAAWNKESDGSRHCQLCGRLYRKQAARQRDRPKAKPRARATSNKSKEQNFILR